MLVFLHRTCAVLRQEPNSYIMHLLIKRLSIIFYITRRSSNSYFQHFWLYKVKSWSAIEKSLIDYVSKWKLFNDVSRCATCKRVVDLSVYIFSFKRLLLLHREHGRSEIVSNCNESSGKLPDPRKTVNTILIKLCWR